MKKINLLPAHPDMGWESMNRYYYELRNCGIPNCSIVSPFEGEFIGREGKSRIQKFFSRSIGYPLRIWLQEECDLTHILDHSFSNLLKYCGFRKPSVVTVHDLIPLSEYSLLSNQQKRRFRSRIKYLKHASHLVCVSEYTANELMREMNISHKKISVVLNGVNNKFFVEKSGDKTFSDRTGNKKIILLLGTSNPRKNLAILPDVVSHLNDKKEYCVVKAGRPLEKKIKSGLIDQLGTENVHELGFVPENMLPKLLSSSFVLLFPSLCEGFGLPVLESMAAGCPVVCSNSTSIPEVGGDSVLYFHPTDFKEAASLINLISKDELLRGDLIVRARETAKKLTWSNNAHQLSEIYEKVIQS